MPEPTKDPDSPSRTRRATKHVKSNPVKYGLATVVPMVITALQLFGALGPVLCTMPWVDDQAACLATTQAAKTAARELGQLDGMSLDDGPGAEVSPEPAPIPTNEVDQ